MNARTQRVCTWCGPLMLLLWLIAFAVFAQFLPPPSPEDSPEEIAEVFRDDTNMIRFGLMLTVIASSLLMPFISVITNQMRRIEGANPVLAYTQLACGALIILEFIFPIMFLQAAAYRGDRSPELIQLANDIGWLMFVGVVATAVLQMFAIGWTILQDQRDDPVFPRWVGYYNFWVGTLVAPGSLCVFFKDGPLAWEGVWAFWAVLAIYSTWFAVMTYSLFRAIRHQELEEPAAHSDDGFDARRQIEFLTAEVAALRVERRAGTTAQP